MARIRVPCTIELDAPDEETGEKYVDEMLEDLSTSTVLHLTYRIGSTEVISG